jgi:ABC-type multidrug transport system fused ATPase/permease subunit
MFKPLISLYKVLNKKEKKMLALILLATISTAIFELVGFGAFIPAINLAINIEKAQEFFFYDELLIFLSYFNSNLLGITVLLGLAFLLRTIGILSLTYFKINIIYAFQENLTNRLISVYLNLKYSYIKTRNSSSFIRNLTQETVLLTGTMKSYSGLLTEVLVVLFFGIVLVAINPLLSIISITFISTIGFLIYQFNKTHLIKFGELRAEKDSNKIQVLQEIFSGYKILTVMSLTGLFQGLFSEANSISIHANKKVGFAQEVPRLLIEFLFIFLLVLIAFLMINIINSTEEDVIYFFGVLAIAALRVLPSISRIVSYSQGIRYSQVIIKTIIDELNLQNNIYSYEHRKETSQKLEFANRLTINSLSFAHEGAVSLLFKDFNLEIKKNTFLGILGKSGSGKSTLIDIIMGLYDNYQGEILVDHKNIKEFLPQWRNVIGYVPQETFISDNSLRRNIAFGLPDDEIDDHRVLDVLKRVDLIEFFDSVGSNLDYNLGESGDLLSGGQKQRIGIARALYRNPEVLILDESTSALDVATEEMIMKDIYNLEKLTVIIISHRESTLSGCNEILSLDEYKKR